MSAADCITAFMSDAQPHNIYNMHIKTQPKKNTYADLYRSTQSKKES